MVVGEGGGLVEFVIVVKVEWQYAGEGGEMFDFKNEWE